MTWCSEAILTGTVGCLGVVASLSVTQMSEKTPWLGAGLHMSFVRAQGLHHRVTTLLTSNDDHLLRGIRVGTEGEG